MKNYNFDVNSNTNQKIKEKFVSQNVYMNVDSMVNYILKKSFEDRNAPFSWDDIENMHVDNSDKIEELNDKIEELNDEILNLEDGEKLHLEVEKIESKISKLEEQIEELESEQEEPQEVFTWYAVSGFLCNKLKEKGEVVLSDEDFWGRGTFGQAILLDYVISEICFDMGILEGQEHEWKL